MRWDSHLSCHRELAFSIGFQALHLWNRRRGHLRCNCRCRYCIVEGVLGQVASCVRYPWVLCTSLIIGKNKFTTTNGVFSRQHYRVLEHVSVLVPCTLWHKRKLCYLQFSVQTRELLLENQNSNQPCFCLFTSLADPRINSVILELCQPCPTIYILAFQVYASNRKHHFANNFDCN